MSATLIIGSYLWQNDDAFFHDVQSSTIYWSNDLTMHAGQDRINARACFDSEIGSSNTFLAMSSVEFSSIGAKGSNLQLMDMKGCSIGNSFTSSVIRGVTDLTIGHGCSGFNMDTLSNNGYQAIFKCTFGDGCANFTVASNCNLTSCTFGSECKDFDLGQFTYISNTDFGSNCTDFTTTGVSTKSIQKSTFDSGFRGLFLSEGAFIQNCNLKQSGNNNYVNLFLFSSTTLYHSELSFVAQDTTRINQGTYYQLSGTFHHLSGELDTLLTVDQLSDSSPVSNIFQNSSFDGRVIINAACRLNCDKSKFGSHANLIIAEDLNNTSAISDLVMKPSSTLALTKSASVQQTSIGSASSVTIDDVNAGGTVINLISCVIPNSWNGTFASSFVNQEIKPGNLGQVWSSINTINMPGGSDQVAVANGGADIAPSWASSNIKDVYNISIDSDVDFDVLGTLVPKNVEVSLLVTNDFGAATNLGAVDVFNSSFDFNTAGTSILFKAINIDGTTYITSNTVIA